MINPKVNWILYWVFMAAVMVSIAVFLFLSWQTERKLVESYVRAIEKPTIKEVVVERIVEVPVEVIVEKPSSKVERWVDCEHGFVVYSNENAVFPVPWWYGIPAWYSGEEPVCQEPMSTW